MDMYEDMLAFRSLAALMGEPEYTYHTCPLMIKRLPCETDADWAAKLEHFTTE